MYIVKGSYADKILIALCLSGEFAYRYIDMLDENKQMLQRNARKLNKEGYISITGKGSDRTMRLRQKGKDFVNERYPALYQHYLMMSDGGIIRTGKSNQSILWRSHRLAEALLILQNAGVYFLEGHKPEIYNESIDDAVYLPENTGFFYSSKEMKGVDEVAKLKVAFTRILGMLSTNTKHYAIYNTNEGLILWNNQGENKAKKMMEDIINKSFYSDKRVYVSEAILFGRSMEVAMKVLKSRKGKKDSKGFEFLSFDNTFPNMYFLTLDDFGMLQVQLLMLDGWEDKLRNLLFTKQEVENKDTKFDSDAFNEEEGVVKIEFISGNIGKLKRAVMAYNFNRSYIFKVYALQHQVEFLKDYLPEEFAIEVVNPGEIYSELLK